MRYLRQTAFSLKRQGYCFGASVFLGPVQNATNVGTETANTCLRAYLVSGKSAPAGQFHQSLLVCEKLSVGIRSYSSLVGLRRCENDVAERCSNHVASDSTQGNEENNLQEEEQEDVESQPWDLDDVALCFGKDMDFKNAKRREASLELLKGITSCYANSVSSFLDKWETRGIDLGHAEISKIIVSLKRRRMYARALKFSEWGDKAKQLELTEEDYASRVEMIGKVHGMCEAEKYMKNIPEASRGKLVYQALLAISVYHVDMKKAEMIFKRTRELKMPVTAYACNQMLILYKMLDRRKIVDILSIMKENDVKPSRLTYRLLIDIKGESNDIDAMEQLADAMKSDGVKPDVHILSTMTRHYISAGLTDKAEAVLKEIQNMKDTIGARRILLPLYASLGSAEDVDRIWKDCESEPTMNECIAAIEAWGKLGKVEEAEAIFNMMVNKWKKLSSRHYAALLKVYVDHKLVSKGQELVKRMGDCGCWIGPLTWDALVSLLVEAGNISKAHSVLQKGAKQNNIRPLFRTYMHVMEQYAKQGDVHNTEKLFQMMRQRGYGGRLKPFEIVLQAYSNAKIPPYGLRERMKAESVYPTKSFSASLAKVYASLNTETLVFDDLL